MMKLINQTPNGRLTFCKCCNIFQLEYGNILFSFPKKEFSRIKKYIKSIDAKTCCNMNKHACYNRKIFLQFPVKSILFCLHPDELEELKELLFIRRDGKTDIIKRLSSSDLFMN